MSFLVHYILYLHVFDAYEHIQYIFIQHCTHLFTNLYIVRMHMQYGYVDVFADAYIYA